MDFFDYFQVASVAITLLIVAAKALYLRSSQKINPIVIGRGKRGLQLVAELIAFAGLVFWIIEVLSYAFHSGYHSFPSFLHALLINSWAARISGVVLITGGLILFALAFLSFGSSWRVGIDVNTPGALVTKGVFAWSRNPIYVFLDVWFIGIFLINGTLIFLIFAVLAVAVIHWQVLQEERFLSQFYGQPYEDYRARTGRYFVW